MTGPRIGGVVASTALAATMFAGLAPAAHAIPRFDPTNTQQQLSTAQTQAQQLRGSLDRLRAQQDIAQERLGYIRDQLAVASSQAVSADQQLQFLQGDATTTTTTAVNRVRALYMTGGAPALYSSILGGSDIGDVINRMFTIDHVLADDSIQRVVAADAVQRADLLHNRLNTVARTRAQLSGQAAGLVQRLQRLQSAQRKELNAADASVKRLAEQLQQDQQAAAQQAAQNALRDQGLLEGPRPPAGNPYGDAAIAAALSKLGSPYVWGAEGPDTFDCSGLMQWSYAQAGLALPRLADEQYFAAQPVQLSDIKPGDFLVYAYDVKDASTIHHITMYIGNGLMVEAPHTGALVRVVPVYFDGLYGAARPGVS